MMVKDKRSSLMRYKVKTFFLICLLLSCSFCKKKGADDEFSTKGLILAFKNWPSEKEEALILKKIEKADLKKKSELKEFKTWVFEWTDWHIKEEAEKLCEEFSSLSSIDYCEPDSLQSPAQ